MICFQTSQDTTQASREAMLDGYIRLIAQGSRDGLEALYRETRTAVYAYALSILKDPHDAEDVLQDCFLRIHEAASAYSSTGKSMAWIMTIARNLCLMRLRQRQRTVELDEQDWTAHFASNSGMDADDRIVLAQCMSRLSEQERQIVTLHAVAGFKHREIAHFLQIPLATVLSKYHRSMHKLRKLLFKGEDEHEP